MPKKVQLDETNLKESLQAILAEIQDTNDPSELNAYRAAFRKYIPLFSRAYVAAYLLRKLKPATVLSNSNHTESRREPIPPQAPKEGMVTLFIGIGRSRHVYPRDLLNLLIKVGGVNREQINSIKILDNYSFVDIEQDQGQKLIDKLNGTAFRGRPLAINFAKKRD